jgi:ABC-type phosphate transport system permease subunit
VAAFARRFAANLREENAQQTEAPRQRLKQLEAELAETPPAAQQAVRHYIQATREAEKETAEIVAKIDDIKSENARYELRLVTAQGQEKTLSLGDIVRAYPANQLAPSDKFALYFSRWAEFLHDDPREANSEGGVFPAIWGTVAMTLIMALFVAPFGVLAALYLREYAKAGPIVSAVRISINNLAGVPSIVFGVFGMGFFCYLVGAYVDGGPANANLPIWPKSTWFATLFTLVAISVLAFLFSLYSITRRQDMITRTKRHAGYASVVAWLVSSVLVLLLVATTPLFSGWFETNLPNPKFGKGGLLWSSLTLALLTLPVVIVATEEALSAVPNSLREGSYACGAGKWQTIRRIVLPHAMPGIMTGMILAMARGAGEVAPLMLVGAVKLAPELPLDGAFPFLHADRSFMHLGFHIYDLGFQSQNSEAAKPMVYTTTLLLIVIIALLNIAAVWLRSRLRKRFVSSAF